MAPFRPFSLAKRRSSSNRSATTDSDSLYTMSSTSTGTFSHRRSPSRDYDTGFPDMARTTNWRHPEANTSPDACISAEDVDIARATHRHRKSFLYHKYKRTTSHGFIASAMEQEYLSYSPRDWKDSRETGDSATGLEDCCENAARPSTDDRGSMERVEKSSEENRSPESPSDTHFEPAESPHRRGLFRRLRAHSIRRP